MAIRRNPRLAPARRRGRGAVLALAPALLLAACARGEPVHVVSVRVVGVTLAEPLREAGIDAAAVDAASRAALEAAGFKLGDGARPHRAEASVGSVALLPPESPGAATRVELSLELALSPAQPGKGGVRRETGRAAVPLGGGDPGKAWRAALSDATRQAAEGLALAFATEAKSDEQVLVDLSSKDPRVRDHAVRVLADRHSRAAVPALIEQLRDPDPKVVHRAVGALAQIGDERAVTPLIDLSNSGDPALVARVARLIGDVGGDEAEGYLLTLEAGHPDPRVRVAARDALGEMRSRAERAPGPSARR